MMKSIITLKTFTCPFRFLFSYKKSHSFGKFSDNYTLSQLEIDQILQRKPDSQPLTPHNLSQSPYPIPQQPDLQTLWTPKASYEIPDRFLADKVPIKADISHINKDIQKDSKGSLSIQREKYGLKIPNEGMELDEVFEFSRDKQEETINMRVMKRLGINEETPYETYELQIQKEFNFEMDLYGSETNDLAEMELQQKQLGDQLVPMKNLNNEKYMIGVRNCFTLNISIPGTLENDNPNRFLKDLRPIEEFRHTPLIPIPEKQMQEFRERLERYHRSGVYFEVKKETFLNLAVMALAGVLLFMMMRFVSGKEQEAAVAYQRLKLQRMREY